MWVLSTGALKKANVNNIYDMAGNMLEWTMEGYSTEKRSYRGGDYIYAGTRILCPVAFRNQLNPNNTNYNIGFRPSLYIKQ